MPAGPRPTRRPRGWQTRRRKTATGLLVALLLSLSLAALSRAPATAEEVSDPAVAYTCSVGSEGDAPGAQDGPIVTTEGEELPATDPTAGAADGARHSVAQSATKSEEADIPSRHGCSGQAEGGRQTAIDDVLAVDTHPEGDALAGEDGSAGSGGDSMWQEAADTSVYDGQQGGLKAQEDRTGSPVASPEPDTAVESSSAATDTYIEAEKQEALRREESQHRREEDRAGPHGSTLPVADLAECADLKMNDRTNVASRKVGAKILAANAEATRLNDVLNDNPDTYLKNECRSRDGQWLIMELPQAIKVDGITVSVTEMYSARVKTVHVLGREARLQGDAEEVTRTRNSTDWTMIAELAAENRRGLHVFKLPKPHRWAKYLQFRFLDHYGNHKFCAINEIEVYGLTKAEEILQQLEAVVDHGPPSAVPDAAEPSTDPPVPAEAGEHPVEDTHLVQASREEAPLQADGREADVQETTEAARPGGNAAGHTPQEETVERPLSPEAAGAAASQHDEAKHGLTHAPDAAIPDVSSAPAEAAKPSTNHGSTPSEMSTADHQDPNQGSEPTQPERPVVVPRVNVQEIAGQQQRVDGTIRPLINNTVLIEPVALPVKQEEVISIADFTDITDYASHVGNLGARGPSVVIDMFFQELKALKIDQHYNKKFMKDAIGNITLSFDEHATQVEALEAQVQGLEAKIEALTATVARLQDKYLSADLDGKRSVERLAKETAELKETLRAMQRQQTLLMIAVCVLLAFRWNGAAPVSAPPVAENIVPPPSETKLPAINSHGRIGQTKGKNKHKGHQPPAGASREKRGQPWTGRAMALTVAGLLAGVWSCVGQPRFEQAVLSLAKRYLSI